MSQIISYNTTKHFINRNLERRKRPKTRILHHKGNLRIPGLLPHQASLKILLKQGWVQKYSASHQVQKEHLTTFNRPNIFKAISLSFYYVTMGTIYPVFHSFQVDMPKRIFWLNHGFLSKIHFPHHENGKSNLTSGPGVIQHHLGPCPLHQRLRWIYS